MSDIPASGPPVVRAGHAVVPGTVTWYKRPHVAIDWALEHGVPRVDFLGPDDGSGCWHSVQAHAAKSGLEVSRDVVDRAGMKARLMGARVVLLPSALESLGFSLGEALVHASEVVASPIPAHREVASWLWRAPLWLIQSEPVGPTALGVGESVTPATLRSDVDAAWHKVADELGIGL